MKKPHQSIRVFESPRLERLTHVHPVTPLLLWSPIITYLLWRAVNLNRLPSGTILSLGVLGFLVWTLTEYLLHRYIFHFAAETPQQRRIQFLIHGLHHDDPVDPTRLVMPPVGSIFLGILLYLFYRFFLGPAWIDPFFAFFAVGYLCYDYTHYAVHHFNPRTRFGKWVKRHHMLHHFTTPNARWGVSSPFWDYVFGTATPVQASSKKEQTV